MQTKKTFLKMKIKYNHSIAIDTLSIGKVAKAGYFVQKQWKNPYNPLTTSNEVRTFPDFESALSDFSIWLNVRLQREELTQEEVSSAIDKIQKEYESTMVEESGS